MKIGPIKDDRQFRSAVEWRNRFASEADTMEQAPPPEIDARLVKAVIDGHRGLVAEFDEVIAAYRATQGE